MTNRHTHRASELVMHAAVGGETTFKLKITSAGSPDHVYFKDYNLPDMADANYAVICDGETASQVHVDESTITAQGFDILHGVAAEIIHVLICGKQSTMPQV
jgi:hypothetical protein